MPASQEETSWSREWNIVYMTEWAPKILSYVRHSPMEQTLRKCKQWLNEQNWNHNLFLPQDSGYLPRMMKWSEWGNFENGEKKKCKSDTTIYHPIMRFCRCSNFVLPSGLVKMSAQFKWLLHSKFVNCYFWCNHENDETLGKCVWCKV